MQRTSIIVALLVTLAEPVVHPALLACGDKFLVMTRGTRFQRAPEARPPAAILLYENPATALPGALATLPIDSTLRKAGYRPTSVSNADDLEKALREGMWDLVLVDNTDSAGVGSRLRTDATPAVLPVLFNPTSAELAQARKRYPQVIKSPIKTQALLDAIDTALALRTKALAKAARAH